MVSRMSIDNLYDIIKQAKGIHEVEDETEIELIRKDGLILYSNYNKRGILKQISHDWENLKKDIATGKRVGSKTHYHQGHEEISVFSKEQGHLDFKGNNWILTMCIPAKVVFAPAVELKNRIIIILLVISVCALIIIFFFSRTVSEPLIKLSRVAGEIGKGNLNIEAKVTSKDEIGHLAAMFNKMARDLKEHREKLLIKNHELENVILQLQDSLAKVKTLSGFLPICASCKNVRNDKGYWTQIEAYISDNSEAEFTHSICPDCMKKLYPGIKIETK